MGNFTAGPVHDISQVPTVYVMRRALEVCNLIVTYFSSALSVSQITQHRTA